jgi:sulfatase maturation enzyme AslB (radical SAM superfamily)
MQEIKGQSKNIYSSVVGLFQKKSSLFKSSEGSNVFVLKDDSNRFSSIKAYISSDPIPDGLKGKKAPYIENIPRDRLSFLKEGDVVLATPEGRLRILYDTASIHNCIYATSRCNLKCIMCPQPPSSDPDPLMDNQIDAIRLMARHKPVRIAITGGEPTLLGPDLLKLLTACKKYIPDTPLIILTNGKKLKDFAFVKSIVEIQHPDLQFAIPLYSDSYSTHDKIVGSDLCPAYCIYGDGGDRSCA